MARLGWTEPDIILVSGDAYMDSPFSGVAMVGHALRMAGFRVAIIPQPDLRDHADIRRLGQPRLFWGVTSGCVDSMVANYTASGRRRQQDDFTPGGRNDARPDRAVIAYCNLIRAACKPCKPIVIGGIEASLRRIAHYDFWSNRVRRPILFDAKADILVYGMAERAIVALARLMRDGGDWRRLRNVCYALPADSPDAPADALELPSFEDVAADTPQGRAAFLKMFRLFADNQDGYAARALTQRVANRRLAHNPPETPPSPDELDRVHDIPFMLDAHPCHAARGAVRALDTIRFSLASHRGCYGACHFCSIAMHQGRHVVSRSEASLLEEARRMTRHPKFNGIIQDVGGPTANMYGIACARQSRRQPACSHRRCLFPACCPDLKPDHAAQINLLRKLRHLPGVRKVFVASGIRPDLIMADARSGMRYLDELTAHHVSGQLKLAPEHADPAVLAAMGKPEIEATLWFKTAFETASRRHGLQQFLTYYFIAAHPGCTDSAMRDLRRFAVETLKVSPQQVQIFTPTPSTWSTAMHYTGRNPFTGQAIAVARDCRARTAQKAILCPPPPR